MKTLKPQKRSVSPFGLKQKEITSFDKLKEVFATVVDVPEKPVKIEKLSHWGQAGSIPLYIEKINNSPANDAKDLTHLSQYLVKHWRDLEDHDLAQPTFITLELVFFTKTELFLVDHQNKETCEKQGWPDAYRDLVLFAKERNELVGRFFYAVTEKTPGVFSEFVQNWIETDSPDRAAHLLDFCTGSKNPTFEHYLIFSHPAFAQLLRDKDKLRDLFKLAQPVIQVLKSPTWESDTKKKLEI